MGGITMMEPLAGAMGSFGGVDVQAVARTELRADEAVLISALQAGSDDAFRQLIAQYSGPLYSLLLRSLADPADAADVTQDVFIKVFRSVGSFHGNSSLKTWIYRIAMHEASNSRRWWMRHKRAEITIDEPANHDDGDFNLSLAETLSDRRESPFESARQAQLRATVEAALREVPEGFRTVVILREVEGMAYDEIAEILGINIGTVKSRLMRGRSALRKLLETRLPDCTASRHVPEPALLTRKRPMQAGAQSVPPAYKEAR